MSLLWLVSKKKLPLKNNEIVKLCIFFQQFDILKKVISIHKLCPQSLLKHSVVHVQGIAMEF